MGLCCCGLAPRRVLKDSSTQTDSIPLIEADFKRQSLDNEAKCRSSLETALRLVQQAVEADKARNYEEALSLYQHALVYFLESLNYEAESEMIKNKILSKCKQYLDRAEKLAEYLQTNGPPRRGKPTSLTAVSNSVARWIENEQTDRLDVHSSRNAVSRMYHSIIRKTKGSTSNVSNGNDEHLKRSHSSR